MGLCSLPVSCFAWGDPVLACTGSLVGLTMTSKGLTVNTRPPGPLLQMPPSLRLAACRCPPLRETCEHSQAGLTPSLVGSLLPSPGSWCRQPLFVPSTNLASPVYNQILLASESVSLGIPSPFARLGRLTRGLVPSQRWENFSGSLVPQFVAHLPSGHGIWF